ncbi:MAG: PhzF family phenazine biosynthesis protein [Betaproteobacteria bacterium]|nr:PhzF family phenazine biosynthesis protein [Betaproteobacteria bacterium]
MRTYAYRIINVFTRGGTLTGNPLCVFENGEGLSDDEMQALALQFNLSETTFILPSDKANARVRIFTPAYEMPFAGHPTLGTAHVVNALRNAGGVLKLEMKAGVIPVAFDGTRWALSANAPRWREVAESREFLADMLGLPVAALGERPLWVNAGKEQLVIPLTSPDHVRAVKPKTDPFWRLQSEDGQSMAYVFAPQDDHTIVCRFFFPKAPAILEDPATGSACSNLGGWFVAMRHGPQALTVLQGDQVGRPSTLFLRVDEQGRIFVGGGVVELGAGVINL